MLDPNLPLILRLVLVALPIAGAIWFFSTGSVAGGVIFTGLTGYVFNALFLSDIGGR